MSFDMNDLLLRWMKWMCSCVFQIEGTTNDNELISNSYASPVNKRKVFIG